jgi:hypothetical protein
MAYGGTTKPWAIFVMTFLTGASGQELRTGSQTLEVGDLGLDIRYRGLELGNQANS